MWTGNATLALGVNKHVNVCALVPCVRLGVYLLRVYSHLTYSVYRDGPPDSDMDKAVTKDK